MSKRAREQKYTTPKEYLLFLESPRLKLNFEKINRKCGSTLRSLLGISVPCGFIFGNGIVFSFVDPFARRNTYSKKTQKDGFGTVMVDGGYHKRIRPSWRSSTVTAVFQFNPWIRTNSFSLRRLERRLELD